MVLSFWCAKLYGLLFLRRMKGVQNGFVGFLANRPRRGVIRQQCATLEIVGGGFAVYLDQRQGERTETRGGGVGAQVADNGAGLAYDQQPLGLDVRRNPGGKLGVALVNAGEHVQIVHDLEVALRQLPADFDGGNIRRHGKRGADDGWRGAGRIHGQAGKSREKKPFFPHEFRVSGNG
ncbi:hypothetical protein AFE_0051 [Acidithiobacillus ferrooxidans ATCC 23270]|uniref:Uncharacterized protein n=1 Tax=Acidithiobacillus ferrooxidans (strain ATCC 23270 / DSM 14882 / CIP 104768 / NCIMB 8455) TaxID=243159 RepID=B7J3F2_ACIF2|nr:hypothetical protein AFE_0051 [Acidithiobacillus ferrooxidans ATCC 23270]